MPTHPLPELRFAGFGLLLVALSLPLWFRWVPPNPLYGLRVPATDADDWVWYEANARSARDLFVLGWLQIAVAFSLSRLWPVPEPTYVAYNVGTLVGGSLLCAAIGWLRANRLLKERVKRDEMQWQIAKHERDHPEP